LDVAAYLDRIGYRGALDADAETLRSLHVAHLLAVPFENLSIHRGEPIVLDDGELFDKVVRRRRGGFCYELNGLFAALLRALGFQVTMLSAQVMGRRGSFGPDFDHMALIVSLEERWLADVGFGDSFLEPMRLDERGVQEPRPRPYRLDADGDRLVLLQRDEPGEWSVQYRFRLVPRVYADYAEMCRFHQTSPESHFTRGRVCSLATADGRVTLSRDCLILTRGGERHERQLADEREVAEVLSEHFGFPAERGAPRVGQGGGPATVRSHRR
jgi:N-hydroxyarylamine O-acetyltransferase